jgi:hypothetical protein
VAPTWSSIFASYFASGTVGNCSSCHGGTSTASGLYTWLKGKGQINGTTSALADPSQSVLSWLGGNMPPSGPSSDPAAESDIKAWVAAGALNN